MFELVEYEALLAVAIGAQKANEKGKAFEELCRYLFNGLSGVEVHASNIRTRMEEIDLQIWNAGLEEVLRQWDDVFLVECKNWNRPVGVDEVAKFIEKVHLKHHKNGILVAANGVTGGFAGRGKRGAAGLIEAALLRDGLRILVITLADLQAVKSLDDFRQLLKVRLCLLYAGKIF